jgi:hypothetical protein
MHMRVSDGTCWLCRSDAADDPGEEAGDLGNLR